jgi:hypothetical protein
MLLIKKIENILDDHRGLPPSNPNEFAARIDECLRLIHEMASVAHENEQHIRLHASELCNVRSCLIETPGAPVEKWLPDGRPSEPRADQGQ